MENARSDGTRGHNARPRLPEMVRWAPFWFPLFLYNIGFVLVLPAPLSMISPYSSPLIGPIVQNIGAVLVGLCVFRLLQPWHKGRAFLIANYLFGAVALTIGRSPFFPSEGMIMLGEVGLFERATMLPTLLAGPFRSFPNPVFFMGIGIGVSLAALVRFHRTRTKWLAGLAAVAAVPLVINVALLLAPQVFIRVAVSDTTVTQGDDIRLTVTIPIGFLPKTGFQIFAVDHERADTVRPERVWMRDPFMLVGIDNGVSVARIDQEASKRGWMSYAATIPTGKPSKMCGPPLCSVIGMVTGTVRYDVGITQPLLRSVAILVEGPVVQVQPLAVQANPNPTDTTKAKPAPSQPTPNTDDSPSGTKP